MNGSPVAIAVAESTHHFSQKTATADKKEVKDELYDVPWHQIPPPPGTRPAPLPEVAVPQGWRAWLAGIRGGVGEKRRRKVEKKHRRRELSSLLAVPFARRTWAQHDRVLALSEEVVPRMSGLHKAPAPAKSIKITGSGIKVPPKPPGFHTTTREPKRAHLTPLALRTPPNSTEGRGRKERKLWRERKKGSKFWAVRRRGGPAEGVRGKRVWGQNCGQFWSERFRVKVFCFFLVSRVWFEDEVHRGKK